MAVPAVPRVPWARHYAYLHERWEPGEHCSIIARTGWGKTVLVTRGLLPLWKETPRIMLVDMKGDDVELQQFRPIASYPLPSSTPARRTVRDVLIKRDDRDDLERLRLVVPDGAENRETSRAMLRRALTSVYAEGDIVIEFDELRVVTDGKMPYLNLAPYVTDLYIRGRSRHITVIGVTQAPRWMPGEFYEMPTYCYIAPLRDKRAMVRLNELNEIGADPEAIRAILPTLQKYEYLYVDDSGEAMIVKYPYAQAAAA